MKALVLEDYMKLVYKEVADPVPGPEEVLVEVKATGICGSDVHGIDGSTGRRIPPVIMGHEASGIIRDTGSRVNDWKPGDRVTFDSTVYDLEDWFSRRGDYNLSDGRMVLGVSAKEFRRDGTYAEFVTVPRHILYRLPENVSFTKAAMVEPAAVALHAINLTPVALNDTAVVVGAGMIGLFLVQMLRLAGCTEIVAVDIDTGKLSLAEKLGATIILNPEKDNVSSEVKAMTGTRGADIAFEAVGLSSSIDTAIGALRKGGTLTILGNLSPSVEIPLQTIVTGQLRIQGSCAINGEYSPVLDLLSKDLLNTDAMLSAEVPLSEGADWFRRLYNREKGLNKVILIP